MRMWWEFYLVLYSKVFKILKKILEIQEDGKQEQIVDGVQITMDGAIKGIVMDGDYTNFNINQSSYEGEIEDSYSIAYLIC